MGFTVTEELTFPKYGVTAANCYVTIKATYAHNKAGAPFIGMIPTSPLNQSSPYTLSARWYVYASNDVSLAPLREETISVGCETAPANPIAVIYAAIKEQHFAGKTITDDL